MQSALHTSISLSWTVSLLSAIITFSLGSSLPRRTGCTAPLILPDKPFFVVWNHPSATCESHGIKLNFDQWGIVDNNKDKFVGEDISLFYSLGRWPHYSGSTAYNGGIPQLADEALHLRKVAQDIQSQIVNKTFSGLGVIDFEYWRPLYGTNYDKLAIYQQKSLELARKRFPSYNKTQLVRVATSEFERAARSIVGKTLTEVSSLRPGGRWGYYGYPRCWDKNCNTSTIRNNDKMSWIFNSSTGLYPSIYYDLSVTPQARARFIKLKIHETLRVKAKFSPQDAVILPYALNQNGPYKLFTPLDLSYSIEQPANMGASGVVLWGSSGSMHAKNECTLLQDYIDTTLGPFVLKVTYFFGNCSDQLCHGHGRCVRKDYESVYQFYLDEAGRTECRIPEEELRRANIKRSEEEQTLIDFGKEQMTRKPTLNIINERMASRRHRRSFINKILKFKDESFLYKAKSHHLKGIHIFYANDKKKLPRKDCGVDSILLQHIIGRKKYAGNYDDVRHLPDKGINQEASSLDPHSPSQSFVSLRNESEWNPDHVEYDFDDYVCKCFAGWSGSRCDVHSPDQD